MRIEFSKMQGLGNDFIVFDAPVAGDRHRLSAAALRALANRRTGIGFDQALMLEPPRDPDDRTFYRIFNADGGEVEQCGNGARCIAALLHVREPDLGTSIRMRSPGGVVLAEVGAAGMVSVDMGLPNFEPRSLPLLADAEAQCYEIEVGDERLEIGAVSMGNPHAVLRVEDAALAPLATLGPAIEHHPRFPRRTNVGFMQILSRGHIRLRVHERGVGETLACGTGTCAAVAVGRRQDLLDAEVAVDLPGGRATVYWPGPGERLWLTGPTALVFTGVVEI
jgi:diaminopimelate epimerase